MNIHIYQLCISMALVYLELQLPKAVLYVPSALAEICTYSLPTQSARQLPT